MKILFIGGTGLISTAVVEETLQRGFDVFLLNRGNKVVNFSKPVKTLIADINDEQKVNEQLANHTFDVIIEFFAFTVEHVQRDYRLFKGKTKQYIFISSASAYHKPILKLPITEEVPLENPYWTYSQNKKYAEEYLLSLKDDDFNVTIIRPSHTYNDQSLVFQLKSGQYPYTMIDRILKDKPIVIPDEGKSLWTLTYNKDFAKGFVDVLGNEKTYQNYYHLTSEKVYSWNEIIESIYRALNKKPNIIYISTDDILKVFPEFKGELYGDKKDDAIFDNSKIKSVAPNYVSETEYTDIVKHVVNYYLTHKEAQAIDANFIERYEKLIKMHQ